MAQFKISEYPAKTVFNDGDLYDVSTYDGVSAYTSEKLTFAQLKAELNSVLNFVSDNLYTANGTLLGNRTVTQGGFDLRIEAGSNDFYVNGATANTLFVDGSASRVGIGTATPSETLQVLGNAQVDGTFRVNHATSGYALIQDNSNIRFELNADNHLEWIPSAGQPLTITSNTATQTGFKAVRSANNIEVLCRSTLPRISSNTGIEHYNAGSLTMYTSNVNTVGFGTVGDLTSRIHVNGNARVDGFSFINRASQSGASSLSVNGGGSTRSTQSAWLNNGSGSFAWICYDDFSVWNRGSLSIGGSQQPNNNSGVYINTNDFINGVNVQISNTTADAYGGVFNATSSNANDNIGILAQATNSGAGDAFALKTSGKVNMASLPTSSAGLSAGDLWNDAGTLKIV
jgi:prepilin-type processing-associated H-X9-DG protein